MEGISERYAYEFKIGWITVTSKIKAIAKENGINLADIILTENDTHKYKTKEPAHDDNNYD